MFQNWRKRLEAVEKVSEGYGLLDVAELFL